MEKCMHQPKRSMLPQPKTNMTCTCGASVFEILLCPKHVGTEDTHITGFKCVGCESIYTTISGSAYAEDEETLH